MQKKLSTVKKFLLPLLVFLIAAPFLITSQQTAQQLASTHAIAKEQALALVNLLNVTNELVSEQAHNAMYLLKDRSRLYGAPSIKGDVVLDAITVPNLYMGGTPVLNHTELVDYVTAMNGGTATIFVKSGEQFVRLATNVKLENGARAIGTVLDQDGKAIKALSQKQAFNGVVDILGEPYITRYEPMLDAQGELVGAYYVGFRVDMHVVRNTVQAVRQLKSGFAAVVDDSNHIRFHSAHIEKSRVASLLGSRPENWEFITETIPNWDLRLIVAYSKDEARAAGFANSRLVIIVGTAIGALVVLIVLWQLRRLVFSPIGADPALAMEVVRRIASGDLQEDQVAAKPDTLMANVLEMRHKLRESMETLRNNAESLRLSASVFNHAHDGIFITDAAMRILEVNIAFTQITGYSRDEAVGHTPAELGFVTYEQEFFDERMHLSVSGSDGEWRGETWNKNAHGNIYPAWLDIFTVRSEANHLLHFVGLFSDITEAKVQQQNLERMAYHDPLTQLPNRALLSDRLQQQFARAERTGELLAVCCLDLDGFKPVNDRLGHEAGDHLLIQLAERMTQCLRESDTVARVGGDEFSLLLSGLGSESECEKTLQRFLEVIRQPYLVAGENVSISASIGYTIYPLDTAEPDTLLRHADQAMYQSKLSGGSHIHRFDMDLDRQYRGLRQDRERIEAALPNGEFCLYYQPKVNMHLGQVVSMEALIRWQHPELGLRSPASFLPLIENTDFSIELGDWVIRQAIAQLASWQSQGLDLSVSINVSPRHIIQHDFTQRLMQILSEYPAVLPQKVELEITETAAIEDVASVVRTMNSCKALGVSFALDDFGVGYSSLTYLRRLPVSVIKVDRSFVRDMLVDSNDLAMVAGIISLGRDFHCMVVAEGVETAEHGLQLLKMDCQIAQGYFIAHPMPADKVGSWLQAYKPHESWLQLGQHYTI